MTMVDTIERDGTETHAITHKSDTEILAEARARGVRRIEIHPYMPSSVWPDETECPSIY